MAYTQIEKDDFLEFADSLKKYRRAELIDEQGNDILDILYTDLLPNEQILKQCLKTNTTFLIGRKGTGKSTIFLKMQRELRKRNNTLSCYIDTNTVFESSKTKDVNLDYLEDLFSPLILQKYLLERNFIQSVLSEIRPEIDKRSIGIIDRIKQVIGIDKTEIVKERLEKLYDSIENNEKLKSIELSFIKQVTIKLKESDEQSETMGAGSSIALNVLNENGNNSLVKNLTIQEYQRDKEKYLNRAESQQ